MSCTPGKRALGLNRDLAVHVAHLRQEYATDVLVLPIEEHDLTGPRIEGMVAKAASTGALNRVHQALLTFAAVPPAA